MSDDQTAVSDLLEDNQYKYGFTTDVESETFAKGLNEEVVRAISKKKKGRVLNNNSQIIDLIKNDLNNNDYLMVKASNATGFNTMINSMKG